MGEKETIQDAVAHLGEKHSDEIKKSVEDLLSNIFEKGVLPKDAMGLSDAMVEGIYGHAYRLYNTGKYREASQLFRLLIMLNPTAAKYPLGLAACFHMLKEYENAITSYMLVSMIDANSPIPFYHSGDCYINLNQPELAIATLKMAVDLSGDNEQFAMVKDRSLFTIESLKKDLEVKTQNHQEKK